MIKKKFSKVAVTGLLALLPILSAGVASAAPYTVSGGDTMYLIAQRHGVSLNSLIAANPQIRNANNIWSGLRIQVPGQAVKPAAAAPVKATYASQVVTLVNKQRANAGLSPLKSDASLTAMALDKAADMYKNNYFSHTSPNYGSPFDMMKSYGIKFGYAGENIAKGQQSPQSVMTDWMNSAGHRANIMNANYKKIGVAYYNGEWVQEFTS
jgi:uncharacterized YkwD family protein